MDNSVSPEAGNLADAPFESEENLSLLEESVPFKLIKKGKGKIMLMTDNTNFRAFWFGTNRIFLNMLFHSNIM